MLKAKPVRVGEWYQRERLQSRTTAEADNYNESDLEVNVAAVILEVSCFDHVNEGREDRVGRVLDAMQQRPQPVDDDLALRVEEHEHVAERDARARQPRPRHAHAGARRALSALQAKGPDRTADPCLSRNIDHRTTLNSWAHNADHIMVRTNPFIRRVF